MSAIVETVLTAEAYAQLPDSGRPTELLRGRLVQMNPPQPRHGQICGNAAMLIGPHVKPKLGHLLTNDSGVITERSPDSVRGADLAFYSYANVPKGPLPPGYLNVVPELILEVRSPEDRWKAILRKVAEYLDAGVKVVCVLDEPPPTMYIYTADAPCRTLEGDDEFSLPDILGDFRVKVSQFFE